MSYDELPAPESFEQTYERKRAPGEYDMVSFDEFARANVTFVKHGGAASGLRAALLEFVTRRTERAPADHSALSWGDRCDDPTRETCRLFAEKFPEFQRNQKNLQSAEQHDPHTANCVKCGGAFSGTAARCWIGSPDGWAIPQKWGPFHQPCMQTAFSPAAENAVKGVLSHMRRRKG